MSRDHDIADVLWRILRFYDPATEAESTVEIRQEDLRRAMEEIHRLRADVATLKE